MAQIESKRRIPSFGPGDTVRVAVKVVEGSRERIQAYEGVCIARSGSGLNENFTVRKISYGEGVNASSRSIRRGSTASRLSAGAKCAARSFISARPARQGGPHRRAP